MGAVTSYRRQLEANPFKRFVISTWDCRAYRIEHPGCVTIWPDDEGMTIAVENGGNHELRETDLAETATVPRGSSVTAFEGKSPIPS